MSFDIDRLYSLLPEIYRIRDKEQGGQLKALLSVIADQVAVLEEDLSQLYDDQFIETCADWVVPYIGDLIGFRGIKTPEDISISQRAQVADTISIRKRKGTFSVIERIVRDATGWDCAAVECFRLIATTENLNHLRPDNRSIADVHHWQSLLDTNRPFCIPSPTDRLAHNIDVRSISNESRSRGLYNIPNIAIFIWRLKAQLLKGSPAFKIDDLRYTFSPLGIDTQLFTGSEGTKIPMPISRSMLYSSLRYSGSNIGADTGADIGAISLVVNGSEVFPRGFINDKPVEVIACDLSDIYDDSGKVVGWAHTPVSEGIIALDPQLGRIAFPSTQSPASVRTTFFYGFCENMGGGKYTRWESFSDLSGEGYDLKSVKKKAGSEDDQKQIEEALAGLGTNGGVVEIGGSNLGEDERYNLSSLVVDVSGGKRIEIRSAEGCRPLLVLDREMEIKGDGGTVSLNGLVISGMGIRASTGLERLRISHCTLAQGLVPGQTEERSPGSSPNSSPGISPSIVVASEGPASGITVEIEKSIVGPIRMPAEGALLIIRDSIVDSPSRGKGARIDDDMDRDVPAISSEDGEFGPELTVERSTVLGMVIAKRLKLVSFSIFADPLIVDQGQEGCLRFSFVPRGSQTPKMYECIAGEDTWTEGLRFTSTRYGDPGYCQLSQLCAMNIKQGDGGAEIGVFHDLYQPQRETNAKVRLIEHLKFGIEFGMFYST